MRHQFQLWPHQPDHRRDADHHHQQHSGQPNHNTPVAACLDRRKKITVRRQTHNDPVEVAPVLEGRDGHAHRGAIHFELHLLRLLRRFGRPKLPAELRRGRGNPWIRSGTCRHARQIRRHAAQADARCDQIAIGLHDERFARLANPQLAQELRDVRQREFGVDDADDFATGVTDWFHVWHTKCFSLSMAHPDIHVSPTLARSPPSQPCTTDELPDRTHRSPAAVP